MTNLPSGAIDVPSGGHRDDSRRPAWARNIEGRLGLLVVLACCVFVFVVLEPRLLFRDTTPAGGDTGAHIWFPAYLRDHLLPWRLSGWSPDWYGGFPAGQYYFPFPALLIVLLDLVLPYNVAFKLVTALGPIMLPVGAYVFGRGLRAPRPIPAALAVGGLAFLFFNGSPGGTPFLDGMAFNQHIMGGNLASTLAGEYSFTIALAACLGFFGTLASALRTRHHLWLPAVLLAATIMSHLVVGIWAAVGGITIYLFHGARRSLPRAAAIAGVGALLTAVWLFPLMATLGYTSAMRYEPIREHISYLFPSFLWSPHSIAPYDWGAYILTGIALVAGVLYLRRCTLVLVCMTGVMGLLFVVWEDLPPTPAWNLRILPFWYLGVHLLMAVGVAELIRFVAWGAPAAFGAAIRRAGRSDDDAAPPDEAVPELDEAMPELDDRERVLVDDAAPWLSSAASRSDAPPPPPPLLPPMPSLPPPPGDNPGPGAPVLALSSRSPGHSTPRVLIAVALTLTLAIGALLAISSSKDFLPYWIRWNYTGYQEVKGAEFAGTAKAYPEYRKLVDTFASLPPGRVIWEGGSELDKYGTPLALMLLPYWTHGRIASMEGLYYEAAASTPYTFEAIAALVKPGNASNPVRGIPYLTQADFATGVEYLQMLGVRYFAARSPETKQKADADPRLSLVATSPDLDGEPPGPWSIYEVQGSSLVEPLAYRPVVVTSPTDAELESCRERLRSLLNSTDEVDVKLWPDCIAVPWFNDVDALQRPLLADGPAAWQHAGPDTARTRPLQPLPDVTVSRIRETDDSISFHVSRPGVPVLVKSSYFPNWRASGADGPWRATPNLMVVVPTSHDVRLDYATTRAEWLGRLGTLVGFAGVAGLVVWGRRPRREDEDMATVFDTDG